MAVAEKQNTRYDYLLHATLPAEEHWGVNPPELPNEPMDLTSLQKQFQELWRLAKDDRTHLGELKLVNRKLAESEWFARESRLLSRPSVVQLSQTEVCNLLCTYCRPDKPKGLKTMPRSECIPTLHQILPAAQEFLPFCWGEPLLSPDFLEICELAAEYQSPISLITNLNHLNDELTETFARHVARALISIDTIDPEQFAAVRRRGDLHRLEKNLRAIQDCAAAQNSLLWLGVSVVLTKSSMPGVPDLIAWAADHGFRGVCMRRVVIREALPHFENKEEIDLLSPEYLELLETSKRMTQERGLVLNMPDPYRSEDRIPACRCLWDHVYVSASGTINMCVYSHRQPMGTLPLLDDYWNMPEIVRRRSGWTDDTRCEECCVLDFIERPDVTQVRGY
jgi:MoaA/NifB/PqqE/SkfB family radical SAM enzyme